MIKQLVLQLNLWGVVKSNYNLIIHQYFLNQNNIFPSGCTFVIFISKLWFLSEQHTVDFIQISCKIVRVLSLGEIENCVGRILH